jgi:hypothetical protein
VSTPADDPAVPARVRAGLARFGFRPRRATFGSDAHEGVSGCAVTGLYLDGLAARRADVDAEEAWEAVEVDLVTIAAECWGDVPAICRALAPVLGRPADYLRGLADGWDALWAAATTTRSAAGQAAPLAGRLVEPVEDPALYQQGYADGEAAWAACQDLLVHEENP